MNDSELYQRLARAENQIQALNCSLLIAYKLLLHFSLQLPDQATGIHDRNLINSQIQTLETLKPRTKSRSQRGGRVVYRELFSLKTMLEFLSHAVERHFPPITAIYLPALE